MSWYNYSSAKYAYEIKSLGSRQASLRKNNRPSLIQMIALPVTCSSRNHYLNEWFVTIRNNIHHTLNSNKKISSMEYIVEKLIVILPW